MKNKLLSMLLALLLAFGMWLYVINIVSPGSEETYYNIPVVMEGENVLAERGLMVTGVSAAKVNLTLSGNRLDLSKVDSSTITIKADLGGIYAAGSRIPISYSVSFPGNVSSGAYNILSRSPERLYVSVERRISKSVPVEIIWQGSAEDGFLADRKNRELSQEIVQIVGPQSVVDKIEKAVIAIDLSGLRESVSQDYVFTLCDAEGEPVDAGLITAGVETIHVNVKIQRVKDLTLIYHLIEGGGATAADAEITLSVDTIRVSGSEAALDLMGSELVIGAVNLREITEDCEIVFPITLEDGITNLTGVTEVTARIHLAGLQTAEFLVTDIRPEGVPEGLEAELITKSLTISVRGPAELVRKLTAEDICIWVDLSDAEAGIATYDVRVEFAPGFEGLGTVMDIGVSAQLREAESEQPAITE